MIRPMQENDEDAVADIWLRASVRAHGFMPEAFWKSHVRTLREDCLPLAETLVHVDDDTGRLTGFMSLIDNYIAALFVAPEEQGKGIGTRFLRIAKRMHDEVYLSVYLENEAAIRFYRTRGLVVAGERLDEVTGHVELTLITPVR